MKPKKYMNRYRTTSVRLASWDYSSAGSYFITFCTANRERVLCKIIDKSVVLSPIGKIVAAEWKKSFTIRPGLVCDAFVIMPDHIHALLRIVAQPGAKPGNGGGEWVGTAGHTGNRCGDGDIVGTAGHTGNRCGDGDIVVDAHSCAHLRRRRRQYDDMKPPSTKNQPKTGKPANNAYGVAYRPPKSISSFVAGFKSSATKKINELRGTPGKPVWQKRFHDHVVRNSVEFKRIKRYIDKNPEKWRK